MESSAGEHVKAEIRMVVKSDELHLRNDDSARLEYECSARDTSSNLVPSAKRC